MFKERVYLNQSPGRPGQVGVLVALVGRRDNTLLVDRQDTNAFTQAMDRGAGDALLRERQRQRGI